MKRRKFIIAGGMATAGLAFSSLQAKSAADFPIVRVAEAKRKFKSAIVEKTIKKVSADISEPKLAWLFNNCFPNTLDTTVEYSIINWKPDTYVITGDINAMWLRDSTAQVFPYLDLIKEDIELENLIKGVINRQVRCILLDPYANAFFKDAATKSEWQTDLTDMKPGIHERKWEIDSLCYPVLLSYRYWKSTNSTALFDSNWVMAMETIIKTFKEQQRKENHGSYKFQRKSANPIDTLPLDGYGFPAKPNGLICSMFRPSDDATIFPYLIPSNFFAKSVLEYVNEIGLAIGNTSLAQNAKILAEEVGKALLENAYIDHPKFGKLIAYEIDGFGNALFMDDANIPGLLALPYLGAMDVKDEAYINTRKFILSKNNPYFFKGKVAEGIGGPHVGLDMIWPLGIISRAITSTNDAEIKLCLEMLVKSDAGTGFMHESFHKDDAAKFTRSWFAWANTLFGELIIKIHRERRHLL
ncbi:MAG: glycoside hydrolase family 125 protein [Cytophagales bacterium]